MSLQPPGAGQGDSDAGASDGQASVDGRVADPLASRLRAGEQQVLEELWQTEGPAMQRWLRRKHATLRSFELEDVIWEGLTRLWEVRSRLDPNESLLPRLDQIIEEVVRDRLNTPWHRQQVAERRLAPVALASLPDRGRCACESAEESTKRSCLNELVHQALDRLHENDRAMQRGDACHPTGHVPAAELAREKGISEANVRKQRQRGRAKLRKILLLMGIDRLLATDRAPPKDGPCAGGGATSPATS